MSRRSRPASAARVACRARSLLAACAASPVWTPRRPPRGPRASSAAGRPGRGSRPATAVSGAKASARVTARLKCGRREPLAQISIAASGMSQTDRHLVGGELVRTGGADPVVAGQQEEGAHRDRVAGARDHDRQREGQHPVGELEARPYHAPPLRPRRPADRQVEPGREDAWPAGRARRRRRRRSARSSAALISASIADDSTLTLPSSIVIVATRHRCVRNCTNMSAG